MSDGGRHAAMVVCSVTRRTWSWVRGRSVRRWRVMYCAWGLSDWRLCHLRLLQQVLRHERRREDVLLIMGELRRVWVLLGIRAGNGLIQSTPHGYMVGEVGC